jgi:glycosyltransferase involved in cell wall biosynthesis
MRNDEIKVTVGIPTFNRSKMLVESIRSVLAQSYKEFQLVVSDNASTDDTADVVRSFGDERIVYSRSESNIGLTPNFNRVIELSRTPYVAILSDDDLLYPDYLRSTVAALESHPNVGVVHTGFDLIDGEGRVFERAKMLLETSDIFTVERGTQFLERSMRQDWVICSPSALFRAEALEAVGRFPVDEDPLPDVPMLRRIALNWDIGCVSTPLVAFRIHRDTISAGLGTFTGDAYAADDSYPRTMFGQRIRFLDEARLPSQLDEKLRSIAETSLRRDGVRSLANRAGAGASWGSTTRALLRRVRDDPRELRLRDTWRLIAAQLGGRRVARLLRQLRRRPRAHA